CSAGSHCSGARRNLRKGLGGEPKSLACLEDIRATRRHAWSALAYLRPHRLGGRVEPTLARRPDAAGACRSRALGPVRHSCLALAACDRIVGRRPRSRWTLGYRTRPQHADWPTAAFHVGRRRGAYIDAVAQHRGSAGGALGHLRPHHRLGDARRTGRRYAAVFRLAGRGGSSVSRTCGGFARQRRDVSALASLAAFRSRLAVAWQPCGERRCRRSPGIYRRNTRLSDAPSWARDAYLRSAADLRIGAGPCDADLAPRLPSDRAPDLAHLLGPPLPRRLWAA